MDEAEAAIQNTDRLMLGVPLPLHLALPSHLLLDNDNHTFFHHVSNNTSCTL